MILIDTHAHSYDEQFDDLGPDTFIERAQAAGVAEIYLPNCDQATHSRMMALAARHPGVLFPMAGLHPTYVHTDTYEQALSFVEERLAAGDGYIAVGEIGLDYHWDVTHAEAQRDAFRRQIALAQLHDLPIVIHSREAVRDCIDLVRACGPVRGVFHCFGGTVAEAAEVAGLGMCIGIGGVVTYKKALMRDVAQAVPMDCLLLETDAPYLAPVPHRGRRNESSYLPMVAQAIADLRSIPAAQVAEATTANARRLFGQ